MHQEPFSEPNTPPTPEPPPVLEYAPVDKDQSKLPYVTQILLGFGAYVLAVALMIGFLVTGTQSRINGIALLSILPPVALVTMAFVAKRRWHMRGFAMGVLIAFGLTLLGVGICTVAVLSSMR